MGGGALQPLRDRRMPPLNIVFMPESQKRRKKRSLPLVKGFSGNVMVPPPNKMCVCYSGCVSEGSAHLPLPPVTSHHVEVSDPIRLSFIGKCFDWPSAASVREQ
jgi:hypothetical protein